MLYICGLEASGNLNPILASVDSHEQPWQEAL